MAESVGYSILRNYEIEILEAKFIAFLNQEELNQVVAAQQQQAAAAVAPAAEAPKLEKKADKKN
jgi:ribosomal protein L12E/L44/L45/RPP1/RPP2